MNHLINSLPEYFWLGIIALLVAIFLLYLLSRLSRKAWRGVLYFFLLCFLGLVAWGFGQEWWQRFNAGQENKDTISVKYVRLTGAYSAPFIFRRKALVLDTNYVNYVSRQADIEDMLVGSYELGTSLEKFYQTWEYRSVPYVVTPLIKELFYYNEKATGGGIDPFTGGTAERDFLRIACRNDEIAKQYFEVADYYYRYEDSLGRVHGEHFMETIFSYDQMLEVVPEFRHKPPFEKVIKAMRKCAEKVSFLCMVIDNPGSDVISEISIEVKEARNPLRKLLSADSLEKQWSLTPRAKPLQIERLQPNETRMLLIAIYLEDQDSQPATYLSSVVRPVKISYWLNDKMIQQTLPMPVINAADMYTAPLTWYEP